MNTKTNKIYSVSDELNQVFGNHGTDSRKEAERQAWEEYNAQILLDARKQAGMTQSELAERIGADKSYVSRIERGLTVPSISTFYRVVSAMGLSVELRYFLSFRRRQNRSSFVRKSQGYFYYEQHKS